jgi:hypothetical protein
MAFSVWGKYTKLHWRADTIEHIDASTIEIACDLTATLVRSIVYKSTICCQGLPMLRTCE